MQILSGTELAGVIEEARKAIQTGDFDRAAHSYRRAISDSNAQAGLQSLLRLEHVGQLLNHRQLGHIEAAIRQARDYLAEPETRQDRSATARLTVLLAEALISAEAHTQFRATLQNLSGYISNDDDAAALLGDVFPHYLRLRGLASGQQTNLREAKSYLHRALSQFEIRKAEYAYKIIQEDLQRLALQEGNSQVIAQLAATPPGMIRTLPQALMVVRALRRQGRYEQALQILKVWQTAPHIERAQRFNVLFESAMLSYRLGQRHLTATEMAILETAAREAFDPKEASSALRRIKLFDLGLLSVSGGEEFSSRLYDARVLILQEKLDEAEQILRSIQMQAVGSSNTVYWSMAAAELAFVRGLNAMDKEQSKVAKYGREALNLLQKALDFSQSLHVVELPGYILRLAGHVQAYLLRDHAAARDHWAKANSYENFITDQQLSDEARVHYRESVPTQHDEIIMITADQAASATESGRILGEQIASVIAAIETARSLTLLKLVQQPDELFVRHLPLPEDHRACWNWYADLAGNIPDDTALWLLHATPNRIYHGILSRRSLAWLDYPANKHELSNLMAEVSEIWATEQNLQASTHNSPELMPQFLAQISEGLHLPELVERIGRLAKRISRLVIIAGEELGDIPFAALPIRLGDRQQLLLEQFAVSYMLCASAVQPLAQRTKASRGDYALIVQPPTEELHLDVPNYSGRRTQILRGSAATLKNLSQILREQSFPIVRFDCHGEFDPDEPAESFLRLAQSAADDGRLTRNHLQPDKPQQPKILLHKCGTVIMGACDSAMFERVRREERMGLIRSALAAGASAVVAARWKAEDLTTNIILRQFQNYLRYLPRDIALQRAQLDILYNRTPDISKPHPKSGRILENPNHPSRWACFVLHGDGGWQTRAGWFVRQLRQWRATR